MDYIHEHVIVQSGRSRYGNSQSGSCIHIPVMFQMRKLSRKRPVSKDTRVPLLQPENGQGHKRSKEHTETRPGGSQAGPRSKTNQRTFIGKHLRNLSSTQIVAEPLLKVKGIERCL